MNVRPVLVTAVAAGLVLGGSSVALATPDVEPLSCSEAIKAHSKAVKSGNPVGLALAVATAKAELAAANNDTDGAKILAAEQKLKAAEEALAGYNKKVADAKAVADAACQGPAGEPGPQGPQGPAGQDDKDCSDFNGDRVAAQAFFVAAGPGDPHNLDADDDGQACELEEPAVNEGGQVKVVPSTDDGVETGGL